MLSIFDQKDFERQAEKKLTLNRLQNVLGPQPAVAAEPPATVAVEEPPKAKATPAVAAPFAPKAVPLPPEPPARPVATMPEKENEIPVELQEFADQFTRSFREVLVSTVRDIQAPMAEERLKMETTLDFLTKTGREVEALRGELAGACQKVDSLAKAVQEFSQRLGKAEDSIDIAGAAAHAIQDSQQALERRLELQAGIIRTLHNSLQSREERLDKMLTAFQSLQSISGERSARAGLPEEL